MLEKYVNKNKIKLGFAPVRRIGVGEIFFNKEDAGAQKRIVEEKIKSLGIDYVNLDWLNDEGLLFNDSDAAIVARRFEAEGVDALFIPHCNFGSEGAVASLAKKLNVPTLIWGPRDETPLPSGYRNRDSQCGLFATSKVLNRFGVPFSYITNSSVDDEVFENGLANFLAAASVVKAFRNMRIGQISTRPATFMSVICNEGELLERFGIQVIPTTLIDIVKSMDDLLADNPSELVETFAGMKNKFRKIAFSDENLRKLAALKLAIANWAEEKQLSAVAIQCWTALRTATGLVPCFINGELTGEGLPVICETDIHGAITSVIAQAVGQGKAPTFIADMTIRHPENHNAELLWHCGNFPYDLAKDQSEASVEGQFNNHCPGAGEWEIKGGDITVCRFDGMRGDYSLLMGHGQGVAGPRTKGTFVWAEFKDWPFWEEKFIYGPYIHHCTGIHGKFAPALYEACKYIPGLKSDPVDPDEQEIRRYLRG